jgi:2-polyprenyl-3-methyl-5-hydroxy-6-metoxy-1,4-benzoquinol methylase
MTTDPSGPKTDVGHWEVQHRRQPRMRLPSRLWVGTGNFERLLRQEVSPGARVLEIGFAPGKQLAWLAKTLGARVAGVDFAANGVETARKLFHALAIDGDLRCEDAFHTTQPPGSFDVVYSIGVIEHFDDPRPLVRIHASLLAPGGRALIAIPNYRGVYGLVQRHFDQENLAIHNLGIMSTSALAELAPRDLVAKVETFPFGRLTPGLLSFDSRWPRLPATLAMAALNLVGLLQPFDVGVLCPWLVLRMEK